MQQERLDNADEAAQAALETMEQHAIPPNPNNFSVWHAYHAGDNQRLKTTLDILLKNAPEFTEARNQELYTKFFGPETGEDEFEKASGEISEVLEQTLECLEQAGEDSNLYGKHLKTFTGNISTTGNREDLQKLIEGAITESRRKVRRNNDLKGRLGQSLQRISELNGRLEDVKCESLTDALTGLANRKCFEIKLTEAENNAIEQSSPFSLLMVDIDHFKKFNDRYGHQMGDQVLKLVGQVLTRSFKGRDTAARYGGEEFAIVLPKTNFEAAMALAERVRKEVAECRVTRKRSGEQLCQITLSVGVACHRPGETTKELVVRADQALYRAKDSGRNRVVAEEA